MPPRNRARFAPARAPRMCVQGSRWWAKALPAQSRTAPIFTRLVNFCWSLFQWCLLLLIASALAVGGYLYFRLDDEIRRQVERRLAEFYRDFDVRVGSARFDDNRGISITNLTLTPKAPGVNSQPLLAMQEMYMAGKMRMDQLVTGQMQIDEIVVHGAKLRMVRQIDGQWNARALLPLPHFGAQSPKVKIEGASATIEDAATPASKPWTITGVNLQLTAVQSTTPSDNSEKRFSLEGTTTGLPAKEVQIKGEIGVAGGEFDLLVTAVGLEISPELLANLPGSTSDRLHGADLSGRADLVVKLTRSNANAAIGWSASMRLDRGRIAHPLLPDPLTDVSLLGRADSQHLLVERLSGKCGSAIVVAALDRSGWTDNAPLGLSAKVAGLRIDDRLRTALPESYARMWDRFKPAGLVDAEVKITFDGEKWRPVLIADCRGLSLTDVEKFNYPLEQTTGRVEYQPAENGGTDRLRMNLTGIGGGQPIKVQAELTHVVRTEPEGITTATGVAAAGESQNEGEHAAGYRGLRYTIGPSSPPPHPLGFVKISGSDIPIHEQLLAALPEKAQALTRSLQPQGRIDFQFSAEWKDLSQPRAEVTQEIRLKDCRIQFDRFAYPLQHVHGLVRANNCALGASRYRSSGRNRRNDGEVPRRSNDRSGRVQPRFDV